MNKYELALVVSANVEDEVRTATIEKVNELITRFGGTITDPGTSEKKKLAYDIQHMSEGFYSFIKFEAEATAPAEIESRIRIMDNLLIPILKMTFDLQLFIEEEIKYEQSYFNGKTDKRTRCKIFTECRRFYGSC